MTANALQLPPEGIRQSLLAGVETCGWRTLKSLEAKGDWAVGYSDWSADLGTVFHLFARFYLRQLWKSTEQQMSTYDAEPIMYEALLKSDRVLPADEREDLVWLCRGFCHYKWNAHLILALEERLTSEVPGLDGRLRTITGQPDVVMSDPPDGILIRDYKSGWGRPPSPRGQPDAEYAEGKQYLSERGHFQLDTYGLLAMDDTPAATHVTLQELHIRTGQVREATLTREEIEHVRVELGIQAQKLERAMEEGPESKLWDPHAGAHCARQCPVARSCPIPPEQRGDGAIGTDEEADAMAESWVVRHAQVAQENRALKVRYEATGRPHKLKNGQEVRWYDKDGKRAWGVCSPDAPLDPKTLRAQEERAALAAPVDLEAALRASLHERGLDVA
jgi:hypothetical protein